MTEWIKVQHWYWELYYTHGFQAGPKPDDREWNIMFLAPNDIPSQREGYRQIIHEITLLE